MKRILKFIFIAVVLLAAATYMKALNLDLSWLTEKCFLCNFENRHNCNLCKSKQRRCPLFNTFFIEEHSVSNSEN